MVRNWIGDQNPNFKFHSLKDTKLFINPHNRQIWTHEREEYDKKIQELTKVPLEKEKAKYGIISVDDLNETINITTSSNLVIKNFKQGLGLGFLGTWYGHSVIQNDDFPACLIGRDPRLTRSLPNLF